MGIEYKITIDGYDKGFFDQVVEKTLSATDGKIERNNGSIEILYAPRTDGMPDVEIQKTKKDNEIIFLYNGGYGEAWKTFGFLTSYLATYSKGITVEEI